MPIFDAQKRRSNRSKSAPSTGTSFPRRCPDHHQKKTKKNKPDMHWSMGLSYASQLTIYENNVMTLFVVLGGGGVLQRNHIIQKCAQ